MIQQAQERTPPALMVRHTLRLSEALVRQHNFGVAASGWLEFDGDERVADSRRWVLPIPSKCAATRCSRQEAAVPLAGKGWQVEP